MRRVLSYVPKFRPLLGWPDHSTPARLIKRWILPGWPRHLISISLIEIWLLVLMGLPAYLDLQLASWLTFVALLIMPGYFLADMITWRMGLDWLERLALAFPVGVALLALPGLVAFTQHLTLNDLTTGWISLTTLILVAWLAHGIGVRVLARLADNSPDTQPTRWGLAEISLLALLIGAFILIIPTLALPKIDGDAYAVNSFAADALAGLPLNGVEPLFGTDLGPGVRMVFNQSLPMSYLWSRLADIDPNTLTASASRPVIAVWVILAAYTFGKAAGAGRRRMGLLVASIQLLIYLAAPFMRGDNVSLFFFERTNADKFMVPVSMLPVVFAFAIRYIRDGRRDTWLAAAMATVAVSTIHPLIAAMQALALTAFGAFHLLLGFWRWTAWKRTLALAGLVMLVMFLPVVQLFLARGEAPLAPSYPNSFEGWPLGRKLVPALPFMHALSLDLYGPLPDVSRFEAGQANITTNPLLLWRFAVNMSRRRLIVFDLDQYISDPNIMMEPPYLLALLLLPILLWRIHAHIAAQFAVSVTLAILFVMFNPLVTPLIGALVMPWILWRFVWLLPYALIIALSVDRFITGGGTWGVGRTLSGYATLTFILGSGLLLSPAIAKNIQELNYRSVSTFFYPTPARIFARLNEITTRSGPVTVLTDQELSVTIPAYVAKANIVAHRMPTTSEIFPADQQHVALQRLIDQDAFFHTPYLTTDSIDILQRYDVRYIITSGSSALDLQLRLAPHWFEWLEDDQSYSLYAVHQMPTGATNIRANTALAQRQWAIAQQLYQLALEQSPGDLLASFGLVEIARAQGKFDVALTKLQEIVALVELPILHYKLGQFYTERNQIEQSIIEFDRAQRGAPHISHFHIALGDACLRHRQESCAAAQYRAAVENEALPDAAARLIAQADLWRQRQRLDQALPLYERAVALRPNEFNRFVLERAYREAGRFDHAAAIARQLRAEKPLSADVVIVMAEEMAAQNRLDEAIGLYRQVIWLQNLQGQDTVTARLALAQLLLQTMWHRPNRLDEAQAEIDQALHLQPYSASGYKLQGDLYGQQQQFDQAIAAYQRAFQLDPTQLASYMALTNQLQQQAGGSQTIFSVLQTALAANPDEATLLVALGDYWQRHDETQSAIDAYQLALDKLNLDSFSPGLQRRFTEQSRAVVYARLAQEYEELGQLEPAMYYYQAAAGVADLAWSQVLLGDALRRRNDPGAAEASYRQAIERDSTDVNAYTRLADLRYAQGDIAEANKLYERALQLAAFQLERLQGTADRQAPARFLGQIRSPTLILESGETPAAAGDYSVDFISYAAHISLADRTTSDFPAASRSISEAAEEVYAVRVLARLYQVHHQPDQALRLYQGRLQQGEREGQSSRILAQYYNGLGDLYLAQSQFDQAVAAHQQAVTLDEWWPEARLDLAEALLGQGHIPEALRYLQTAVDIAPGSVEAQIALANALDRWGDRAQALTIYEEAAQAHPGQARVTLALARAWQVRERWRRAEQLYYETIAMNPGVADAYIGLAELFMDQARYQEAETLLQRATGVDRQNTIAYIRLGELEERRGSPDQALMWYRQAAAIPPANQSVNMTLIDALIRYGDYTTTLGYVQEWLSRQPGHSELMLRLGRIQQILGRYPEAEATLLGAKQLDPLNSRPYAALGELYLAQNRLQEAIALYQQAITLQPAEAAYYLAISQILAAQGEANQALAMLSQGQSRVSQPDELYIAMARLYGQQGKPELILKTLEQGIEDVGETAQLLVAMGMYHILRGDFDQVERRYTEALELRPDAAAVHVALADLLQRRGNNQAALAHYEQAVALEPDSPGYLLTLGDAYRRDGRIEESIARYSQALTLAPTMVDGYLSLANLYQEQERWDEAQAVYGQGLGMAPASGRLLAGYGLFKFEQGDDSQALALFDQAMQVAPTAATLIARASLYQKLGRLDEARQDLQSAWQKEPGSIDALIALGDLYREAGDADIARQMYQAAISLRPGVPTGHLRLGELAVQEGNRDEALQYAKAARDAEPGSLVRPDASQR